MGRKKGSLNVIKEDVNAIKKLLQYFFKEKAWIEEKGRYPLYYKNPVKRAALALQISEQTVMKYVKVNVETVTSKVSFY